MALITCTECGKEYSDKASACINCGCPTEVNVSPPQQEGAPIQSSVESRTSDTPKNEQTVQKEPESNAK
ncbi:hypothetical protein, partial [Vibrio parahaemolyticus]